MLLRQSPVAVEAPATDVDASPRFVEASQMVAEAPGMAVVASPVGPQTKVHSKSMLLRLTDTMFDAWESMLAQLRSPLAPY